GGEPAHADDGGVGRVSGQRGTRIPARRRVAVIGLLLALCFATGVGLILLGLSGRQIPANPVASRLRRRLSTEELGLKPGVFFVLAAASALLGWLLAWWLARVPILALAAAATCGDAPLALARRAA